MTTHTLKATRIPALCKCGCGVEVPQKPGSGRPRLWIEDHKPKKPPVIFDKKCECGCGLPIVRMSPRGILPRYFPGHSPSAIKYPTRNKVP